MQTPLLALCLALLPQASLDQADGLASRKQWAQAAEAYQKVLDKEPENGSAWFGLGQARLGLKEYSAAAEAYLRAAHSPEVRPSSLYNAACARSLGGQVDEAHELLTSAREAGFMDFDLMATDSDLEALRAAHPLELPAPGTYVELKARNGVRMRYRVLEPAELERARPHPVLVAFAPGSGPRSADWMLEHFFGGLEGGIAQQTDWIVVCVVPPEKEGWYTHPTHHALEELLRKIQSDYKVEGEKLHLFSVASGGGPATTYASMSGAFWQSVTLAAYAGWSKDDDDLRRFRGKKVLAVAGALDEMSARAAEAVQSRFTKLGVDCASRILPEKGFLLEGWRGAGLLADLDALRPAARH